MVEAREQEDDYGMEEEKTFLEEPAILDKYKAAAVITDGKLLPTAPSRWQSPTNNHHF